MCVIEPSRGPTTFMHSVETLPNTHTHTHLPYTRPSGKTHISNSSTRSTMYVLAANKVSQMSGGYAKAESCYLAALSSLAGKSAELAMLGIVVKTVLIVT
jgi:hypothetical protein